jgi:hypothetical protein
VVDEHAGAGTDVLGDRPQRDVIEAVKQQVLDDRAKERLSTFRVRASSHEASISSIECVPE